FDLMRPGQPIIWHTRVEGFRADHAALSPDGAWLAVSASTAKKVHLLDARTGLIVGAFAGGFAPHQNDYSPDGRFIYNGSTGNVLLPHALDALKGARQLTIVDAQTLEVVDVHPFSEGLRPTVLTPDGLIMYAQLSYLNGVVRYDLSARTITDRLEEP